MLDKFFDVKNSVDVEGLIKNILNKYSETEDLSYTVYIPSKARALKCSTQNLLTAAGITKWFLVVEPQDAEAYKTKHGEDRILVLPENNQGIGFARKFIKQISISKGEEKHWQIDDDVTSFRYFTGGKKIKKPATFVLKSIEKFCDTFTNIGLASPCSPLFAFAKKKEVFLNRFCYGCCLFLNSTEYVWDKTVSEDIDYTLGILEEGYCTAAFNWLCCETPATGSNKGGNQETMFKTQESRKQLYERTIAKWPNRFKLNHVGKNRGYTLKNIRRFYDDYTQIPIEKV